MSSCPQELAWLSLSQACLATNVIISHNGFQEEFWSTEVQNIFLSTRKVQPSPGHFWSKKSQIEGLVPVYHLYEFSQSRCTGCLIPYNEPLAWLHKLYSHLLNLPPITNTGASQEKGTFYMHAPSIMFTLKAYPWILWVLIQTKLTLPPNSYCRPPQVIPQCPPCLQEQ